VGRRTLRFPFFDARILLSVLPRFAVTETPLPQICRLFSFLSPVVLICKSLGLRSFSSRIIRFRKQAAMCVLDELALVLVRSYETVSSSQAPIYSPSRFFPYRGRWILLMSPLSLICSPFVSYDFSPISTFPSASMTGRTRLVQVMPLTWVLPPGNGFLSGHRFLFTSIFPVTSDSGTSLE